MDLDYTREECISEINEEFKKRFGFYMCQDPDPKFTKSKLIEDYKFWLDYEDRLQKSLNLDDGKSLIGKLGDIFTLEQRKNLTKICFIQNIIFKLQETLEQLNFI